MQKDFHKKILQRKKTRQISVGGVKIGGNAPVVVQSMTKTDTKDVKVTLVQIKELQKAGCEIVRLAILDHDAALSFGEIAHKSVLPLVADIHFDYQLAIECVQNGAAKIRFNPGNVGSVENIKKLVSVCKKAKIPIRIGVNSGSLEKDLLQEARNNKAASLVKSALRHVKILEQEDFFDICVSIKSSDTATTVEANKMLSMKIDYPLHLGVTEAGLGMSAIVKSSVGISALLCEGIGDTIRVSMTGDPIEEVKIAKEILQSLKIRKFNRDFISCPTCGRTQGNIVKIAQEIEEKTKNLPSSLTIAVMGCVVNGPGEAKEADYALMAGKDFFAIYKNGEFLEKVTKQKSVQRFLSLIKSDQQLRVY